MARPQKKPEDRKDYHLRIPLNAEQRQVIAEAAELSQLDMAGWARAILLRAAKAQREKEARDRK